NRFKTKKVLNVIRWFIIFYALITWTYTFIGMAMSPEEFAFINRATGPYKVAYWMMFLCALLFPFTLLIKRLATKFLYVALVAFAMKIGFYFEFYVIIISSLHRDSFPLNEHADFTDSFAFGIGALFLQGVIIAVLCLGLFEIEKRKKIN